MLIKDFALDICPKGTFLHDMFPVSPACYIFFSGSMFVYLPVLSLSNVVPSANDTLGCSVPGVFGSFPSNSPVRTTSTKVYIHEIFTVS